MPDDGNKEIIEEFRANAGRVGGPFEGATLVLLTSVGARSGRRHTVPLATTREGELLLVYATNAGRPSDPDWYANVLADSRVTVEIGTGEAIETYEATAMPLRGTERDEAYARQSERVPRFAEYEAMTPRVIPVVALHRADSARGLAIGDQLVQIHELLRGQLADLRAEVEAYLTGDAAETGRPDLAAQLRLHCVAFCDGLGEHHQGEETQGFPPLARVHPELTPVLERLRREHAAVTRMKDDLRAALDGIDAADPASVRAVLDRVTAELDAHYAYEEKELVTVLNAMTAADWGGPKN